MKEVTSFNITEKEFKLLSKKAEAVYNISVVADYFCETQQEIEELYNLTPIIKNLRTEDDFLGRGGAGSAISLLYNENLTKYSALFICTVIKISAKKFNYNDALTSDNLKFLNIKLPILYSTDGLIFIDKEKNIQIMVMCQIGNIWKNT